MAVYVLTYNQESDFVNIVEILTEFIEIEHYFYFVVIILLVLICVVHNSSCLTCTGSQK